MKSRIDLAPPQHFSSGVEANVRRNRVLSLLGEFRGLLLVNRRVLTRTYAFEGETQMIVRLLEIRVQAYRFLQLPNRLTDLVVFQEAFS